MSILKFGVQWVPGACYPSRTLHSAFPSGPVRFHRVICALDKAPARTARRQANYQPSLWSDDYIQSIPNSSCKSVEADAARITLLKERVKKLLRAEKAMEEQLELIDVLQQLGVAYHFKKDIKHALWIIHRAAIAAGDTSSPLKKDDLGSISLLFRLLREQSFTISEDIFKCFRDDKGCWGDMNLHKTEAVLSLYEASYLAMEGEIALEEARDVTTTHLKTLLDRSALDDRQRESVTHALDLPMHWRMPRLHTRLFIEAYQERPNMDTLLLEFAKLDFNAVQSLYIKELKELSGWWNGVGMGKKLQFLRDRLVENYFCAIGAAFEPQLRSYREVITKTGSFMAALDDIYDVYGTLDELDLFTDALDRWEADGAKQLPEYMKICFLELLKMNNDIASNILKKKGMDVIPHFKALWRDLCKAFLVESKWYHHSGTPKFEEYLDNAWMTAGGHIVLKFVCCMSEDVSQRNLETFTNSYHDFLKNTFVIIRLCNDLGTSGDELARGDVSKAVQCYMRDKDISEDTAREYIKELITAKWRAVNGNKSFNFTSQEHLNDVAINLIRTAHCLYQHGDGYGKADGEIKDGIMKLLMVPISM